MKNHINGIEVHKAISQNYEIHDLYMIIGSGVKDVPRNIHVKQKICGI